MSLKPEDVLTALDKCPAETLKAYPFAILVLMRRMFTWRQIPKNAGAEGAAADCHRGAPGAVQEERGNLLGECDLILSFLCYNDISAMSRLHRSASAQMSRPAISIQNSGGWTFGSPSVLMMFYRAPGELESELAEMDECMPHYYKVTNHHGQGAETIMRAEALFCQGRFTDAHIELERAYAQVKDNGRSTWHSAATFCRGGSRCIPMWSSAIPLRSDTRRCCAITMPHGSTFGCHQCLLPCAAGETDKIPEIFSQHRLSAVNMFAPGKPMMEMIENQVYLAQGAYAKVVGRIAELLPSARRCTTHGGAAYPHPDGGGL